MIKLITFLLLFSFASYGQSDIYCEDDKVKNAVSSLALPNCLKTASDMKGTDYCETCGTKFTTLYTGNISQKGVQDQQKLFLDLALKEFKKNISNNLVSAVKLLAMPETGAKLSKSIASCKMKSIKDFENGCKSPQAIKLLKDSNVFQNLETQTANELAKVLSNESSFNSTNTLLKRDPPACFIPEKQLLYLTFSALEETFTPSVIEALQKIDPKKYKSADELFESDEFSEVYESDITDLKISAKSHPLLKDLFKSPESVASFFKGVKAPYSLNNLKEHLYSAKTANSFDESLAENCSKSFKSLKDSICSDDFESGNIHLNPLENFEKLTGKPYEPISGEFASSDSLIEKNKNLLQYCPVKQSKDSKSLLKINRTIASSIDDLGLQDLPIQRYSEEKYESEFARVNKQLCTMNEKSCIEGKLSCSIYKKYKNIENQPDSVDAKLANSTSGSVKELLRSMIGDTSKADLKTKEILIANGIIPKDDGSFVKQPEIPERQPDYFAKAAANPQQNTQVAQAASISPKTQQQARGPASYDNGYRNSEEEMAPKYSMPDMSDITRDTNELKGIQDEIRRRLSDLPQTPANKAEAKKIVRDSFASRGKTITPAQEESFASQMMEPPAQVSSLNQLNREIASAQENANRAATSNSETQNDKWKKAQAQQALMGMAGAQGVSKDDIIASANAAQDKELTKVALNIAEDPRVTLADIFNNKLTQNDSETQLLKVLLRNKNNFVLQMKSMNFKVVFDNSKQNFNVLLESGDKKEAERVRPQLEMFLKKLRT